jgi:hypothetical protein
MYSVWASAKFHCRRYNVGEVADCSRWVNFSILWSKFNGVLV